MTEIKREKNIEQVLSAISEEEMKSVMNILKAKPNKNTGINKPFKMPKSKKRYLPNFEPIKEENYW